MLVRLITCPTPSIDWPARMKVWRMTRNTTGVLAAVNGQAKVSCPPINRLSASKRGTNPPANPPLGKFNGDPTSATVPTTDSSDRTSKRKRTEDSVFDAML